MIGKKRVTGKHATSKKVNGKKEVQRLLYVCADGRSFGLSRPFRCPVTEMKGRNAVSVCEGARGKGGGGGATICIISCFE